jgi:glycosyltransferase involved in cell wall biosynthesis
MDKKVVNLVFRAKGVGVSIEGVYDALLSKLESEFEVIKHYVPCKKITLRSLFKNILYVRTLNGVVHITGDISYTVIFAKSNKTILTVHDVQSTLSGGFFRKVTKYLLWIALPSLFARRIVVISDFTRKELLKYAPWSMNKIDVIHNPVNEIFFSVTKKQISDGVLHILHCGTKPNKNLEISIGAVSKLDCILMILGKLTQKQRELLVDSGVKYEEYYSLALSEVRNLYEKSDIVLFPSSYEGFGVPVIEANAAQRLIITTNRGALSEVVRESAYIIEKIDESSLLNAILSIRDNSIKQNHFISNGVINAHEYHPDIVARKYIEVYNTHGFSLPE